MKYFYEPRIMYRKKQTAQNKYVDDELSAQLPQLSLDKKNRGS